MKNLDVIEREKQEQEAAEALLSEVQADDPCHPPDPQPEDGGSERLFTREEVQQIVAAAVARERVNQECREYLLRHYYGMTAVTDELDQVLRVLDPKSVEDLAKKMEDIEALDHTEGIVTRTASTSPRSHTTSLKQIFGIN